MSPSMRDAEATLQGVLFALMTGEDAELIEQRLIRSIRLLGLTVAGSQADARELGRMAFQQRIPLDIFHGDPRAAAVERGWHEARARGERRL